MGIRRMEHLGVVVDDLPAAIDFFVAIGLELDGQTSVEGEVVDRITGLSGVRSDLAFLRAPGDTVALELTRFQAPPSPPGDGAAPSHALGIRHVLFSVDDLDVAVAAALAHGGELVGTVENYEDMFRLCYLRGPAGIIVELAERLS